jgi:hypothetical protein
VGRDWQNSFYRNVDTFLSRTRSIAGIIESCFGKDLGSKVMSDWFKTLPEPEQARREAFSDAFAPAKKAFLGLGSRPKET